MLTRISYDDSKIAVASITGSRERKVTREFQRLALMDHPNIAKIFDAGTTESRQPYFVMELELRREAEIMLNSASAPASSTAPTRIPTP